MTPGNCFSTCSATIPTRKRCDVPCERAWTLSKHGSANRSPTTLRREHRNRSAVHPFHGESDGFGVRSARNHIEQGQVVIGRGNGKQRVSAEPLVLDQRLVVSSEEQLSHDLFEANGPIVRLGQMPAPSIGVQVVNQVPTADNQDALLAQRGEPSTYVEVE